MQHHIYHTEAIVLSSRPDGESSRYLYLFTPDFGLIFAHVQNMRSINSKLRFSLQDFSLSKISLVKGKNLWRIIGATFVRNFYFDFKNNKDYLLLCANVFYLLRKLLVGEEKNQDLFRTILFGLDFISTIHKEKISPIDIELILVLKILHNLGYAKDDALLSPFWQSKDWSKDMVLKMMESRDYAVLYVNKAIKETHL